MLYARIAAGCVAAFAVALLAPGAAHAQCGGLCLYELGTPDSGRSAAGAGARAQDASTAYWNAAGMTKLEGTHIVMGVAFGFIDTEFDGTGFLDDGMGGNAAGTEQGGAIGTLLPLSGAFMSTRLYEKLRFGFSLTALYGGEVDYDASWVGRTFVTEASLAALNLQPTVAYPVTDWLSIGVGTSIVYSWLDLEFRASSDVAAPTFQIDDADDWAAAAVVSMLIEPMEGTRIGVTYRSKTSLSLEGEVQGTPAPGDINFTGDMDLAQGINVSVFHQLTDAVALFGDVGWSDWSQFSDQSWSFDGAILGITVPVDRAWKDTWRIAVGAEYQILDHLTLQGGFSYDSDPMHSKKRYPDMPVGEGYRFSIGQRFQAADNIELFASYTGLWSGNPNLKNVTLPDGTVLNGSYDPSWIHFATAGLSINF